MGGERGDFGINCSVSQDLLPGLLPLGFLASGFLASGAGAEAGAGADALAGADAFFGTILSCHRQAITGAAAAVHARMLECGWSKEVEEGIQ